MGPFFMADGFTRGDRRAALAMTKRNTTVSVRYRDRSMTALLNGLPVCLNLLVVGCFLYSFFKYGFGLLLFALFK